MSEAIQLHRATGQGKACYGSLSPSCNSTSEGLCLQLVLSGTAR